jgi:hypothetical protein
VKIIWEGNKTFYGSEKDFSFNATVESGNLLYLAIFAIPLVLLLIVVALFIKKIKFKQIEIFGESDENIVISLLSNHGGVLSQNEIKRLTGFSKSKTSIVIKSLESRGKVKKRKMGRENIIYLVS